MKTVQLEIIHTTTACKFVADAPKPTMSVNLLFPSGFESYNLIIRFFTEDKGNRHCLGS